MFRKLQLMIKYSHKPAREGLHAQRFTRWGFAHGPSLMESPWCRCPCSWLGRCSVCVCGGISHLTRSPDGLILDTVSTNHISASFPHCPPRVLSCFLQPVFIPLFFLPYSLSVFWNLSSIFWRSSQNTLLDNQHAPSNLEHVADTIPWGVFIFIVHAELL